MKKLSELLKPEHIVMDLKPGKKKAILKAMVDSITTEHLVKSKSQILTRLMEREELDSTGVGGGLAFPHARFDKASEEPVVLIGRCLEGCEYDSIDGAAVHLVVMIIWKPEIPGLFNQLFSSLVRQLRNKDYLSALINSSSAEELVDLLSTIEVDTKKPSDFTLGSFSLLVKLQEEERRAGTDDQIELLRKEVHDSLLARYDKLKKRFPNPVVPVKNGVCTGCFLKVSTGLMGKIKGQTDLLVCENCGRFIGFQS